MVTTGGRGTPSAPSSLLSVASVRVFRSLLFEGDHFRLRPEEARHFAGQFRIERLIDGGEHAPHHQPRDHILGANAQLLRQIFHRDSFCDRDVARDRRRLVADGHARRRSVALHRAFLHASRHISLSRSPRRSSRTASRTRWSRRRHSRSRTYAQRTRSRWRHARRMHRPPFTRTKRRTRRSRRWRTRRALKNWLSRHRPSRRGREAGSARRSRRRHWRFVHRARAGLRHDHSRRWRNRSRWLRRRRRLHLRNIILSPEAAPLAERCRPCAAGVVTRGGTAIAGGAVLQGG